MVQYGVSGRKSALPDIQTHLYLPLFHLLPFPFPPVVFGADGGGNVPRVGFDLDGIWLLKAEVVASLKVLLPPKERLPLLLRVLLHHFIIGRDPSIHPGIVTVQSKGVGKM